MLLFLVSCYQNNHRQDLPAHVKKNDRVAVMLYENFDTALLRLAVDEIHSFYQCETVAVPSRPLPSFAWCEPRQRYKADSLIKYQNSIVPAGTGSLVALTQKDISTSLNGKEDWGIFGLGYCPGKACVISAFRLSASTYDQYTQRFIKVVLHELGHNFGLPHCTFNQYCIMNDAHGSIGTVDREKKWLCDHCSKLLAQ